MAYIGNTAEQQAFTPAIDYFSGNGVTTAFTLSRPVASVAQVQATIENVPQNPGTAFTVSGNTITFDGAPASGTNNIYVYYTSPITQVIQPGQGTVGTAQIQSGVTVSFADGSAAAPSITNLDDSNTGIFFPAADTIAFAEGGVEAMRLNSVGNVGIGTASPDTRLQIGGGIVGANATFPGTIQVNENPSSLNQVGGIEFKTATFGAGYGWKIASIDPGGGTPFVIGYRDNNASWTEGFRLTSAGLLQFNSGYGSVATAYGCRAWVNFNGQGTIAIRGSGNVTSITRNGTGNYAVNFTTSMPDTNYAVNVTLGGGNAYVGTTESRNTNNLQIYGWTTGSSFFDSNSVNVTVFR
jgi:hypothetical protein